MARQQQSSWTKSYQRHQDHEIMEHRRGKDKKSETLWVYKLDWRGRSIFYWSIHPASSPSPTSICVKKKWGFYWFRHPGQLPIQKMMIILKSTEVLAYNYISYLIISNERRAHWGVREAPEKSQISEPYTQNYNLSNTASCV